MEINFHIVVEYLERKAAFVLGNKYTLENLFRIINIYFEDLINKNFDLFYDKMNLNEKNMKTTIKEIFIDSPSKIIENNITKIYLVINNNSQSNYSTISYNDINVECKFNKKIFEFKISKKLNFKNFKFNVLALFPELNEENFSLMYLNNDITNYYDDTKILSDIFVYEEKIYVSIFITPKKIVEYHKRCSFCINEKGFNICNKCALVSCENCSIKDNHDKSINLIRYIDFKNYEQDSLDKYLLSLKHSELENKILNSEDFSDFAEYKKKTIEKKFDDIIEKLNLIKNTQINNWSEIVDSMRKNYNPERISSEIIKFTEEISNYKNNPYYDFEESMKKIIEYGRYLENFESDFNNYKLKYQDMKDIYADTINIDNKIYDNLNKGLKETDSIFKMKINSIPYAEKNFHPIMKIYDNKNVLVYDHNSSQFYLMNFIDIDNNFIENFTNFVQFNYISEGDGRLFIITGNPCQKLFCYNLQSNEMELINTLKFNHNWWPMLIVSNSRDDVSKINLFCLSGTYTKKCEQLEINNHQITSKLAFEWKEIPSMNEAHGQATTFILNEVHIYVLFGYDYIFSSISSVEHYEIGKERWEVVQFTNPDKISSILYYHANLKFDDNSCYILGGLIEIDQNDVVYNFEIENSILKKTEHNFQLSDVKFCYEKSFTCINKNRLNYYNSIYTLFDNKNCVHLIDINSFNHQIKSFKIN